DRGAIEGGVELVLVELEPAPKRPARPASPGEAFLPFDGARGLPEDVRTLARVGLNDRERLERIPGLLAGSADAAVVGEGSRSAVARPSPSHASTATNQRPAKSVRPPPTSSASDPGSK